MKREMVDVKDSIIEVEGQRERHRRELKRGKKEREGRSKLFFSLFAALDSEQQEAV